MAQITRAHTHTCSRSRLRYCGADIWNIQILATLPFLFVSISAVFHRVFISPMTVLNQ